MKTTVLVWALLGITYAAPTQPGDIFNAANYASSNVITRDVVVIGGGSSGTYGAVNLRQMGKSVVIVEKNYRLGGPVETYTDSTTNTPVDYGLQAYWNISLTRDYFNLLNLPFANIQAPTLTSEFADFKTGKQVQVSESANVRGQQASGGTSYAKWTQQLLKYPYLAYSWNLPSPVPSDLLLPFTQYVAKYNLSDEAYTIFQDGSGFANILQQPTVDVMKIVSYSYLLSTEQGAITPASHNNSQIYSNALTSLGPSNVLLSSTVTAAQRNSSGVRLVVSTANGTKLIQASKLLVSCPPVLENLSPLTLDSNETSLFSQWTYTYYYSMLVQNTGFPSNYRFLNAVASNATYNIPSTPAPYFIAGTKVPGLFYVWYTSQTNLSQSHVQADVTAAIKKLRPLANSTSTAEPEFVRFNDDTPFMVVAPKQAIADGFYGKLQGLQGHRSTWYTGAAWVSYESPVLWNFTMSLLPQIAN